MKKRVISILLTVVLLVALLPVSAIDVFAVTDYYGVSVDCTGASTTYDENGNLIIVFSGNGELSVDADLTVEIFAVGGGGSGAAAGSSSSKSGCGGNGGAVSQRICKINANTTLAVTIGKGGDAVSGSSTSGSVGKSGGDTSVISDDASFVAITAKGGAGGNLSSTSSAGRPTYGTVCDINSAIYGKGGKSANTSSKAAESGKANTGDGGQAGKYGSSATYRKSGAGGSGVVIIRVSGHPHTFTYAVSAENSSVLTATCTNFSDGCNLPEKHCSLSLDENGYLVESELSAWLIAGAEKPVVNYYRADDLKHPLSGDPLEEGDYVVKATVGEGVDICTIQREFTIVGHTEIIDGKRTVFTEWNSATSLPASAGSYYLANDIILSGIWSVSADINLCLNGHVINLNRRQILVETNANLNICDCKKTEHYFSEAACDTTSDVYYWKLQSQKDENTAHTVKGGVITGGAQTSTSSSVKGGAIIINGGNCALYGGNIAGNYTCVTNGSGTSFGGGVYIASGTFTMYDGGIYGNSAVSSGTGQASGGGIFIIETANPAIGAAYIYGGEIRFNSSSMYAGGVYAVGGPLIVGGTAVIRDNIAKYADYVKAGDKECNVQTGASSDGLILIGKGDYAPAAGMSVGVRRANISNSLCADVDDYSAYFSSDNNGLYVKYDSEKREIKLGDKTADATNTVGIEVTGEGLVYSNPQSAANGTLVTLSVVPSDGWAFGTLTVIAADGSVVPVEQNGYLFNFTMPSQEVMVKAEFTSEPGVYGKVVSIGGSELDTTVELLDVTRQNVVKTLAKPGENVIYKLADIENDNYVFAVSKPGYTTRYYNITVENGVVIKDAELFKAGDSNGDGVFTADDYSFAVNLALSAQNTVPEDTELLSDYKVAVADADGDGITDAVDCALVERLVNGIICVTTD